MSTRKVRPAILVVAGAVIGALIAVGLPPRARGQGGFFRVSPGPLSESHAELDNSESCSKCHQANEGVPNGKCLDCHKGLRDRMARGLGLHATFTGRCLQCHPGHKGRSTSIIDWKHVGGQQAFKHELTGFPLTNQHAQLACTACHSKRMKSGRITYLGLHRECQTCHNGVHRFTKIDLIHRCDACHDAGKATRGMRLSAWSDEHQRRTQISFAGKHLEAACTKCHPKADLSGRSPPRTCPDCHRPSHPSPASLGPCTQCHKADQPWKDATVDHRRFGFALLGKHAKLDCKRCHARGATPTYTEGACTSCHQHRDAHKRQFADKPCSNCHIEGGKRTQPFNHNKDTRFPLLGFHADPKVRNKCVSCHSQEIFRTNKLACADCHRDRHKGQAGTDCVRCHTVSQRWKEARQSQQHLKFPLEGLHRQVKCDSCHPGGKYKLGHMDCADCHAKTDPHGGRLGRTCDRCHVPEKGAPKFNHERMTKFVRTGAHRGVACGFCHQPPPATPPQVGWTKGRSPPALDRRFPVMGKRCVDCHADPHKGAAGSDCGQCHSPSTFDAVSAGARLTRPSDHDRGWLKKHTNLPFDEHELGAEGRTCGRCHGTPACDRCHRTVMPKSHSALWRLRAHGTAATFDPDSCRTCHVTGTCVSCHRASRPLNHRGAWKTLHGYAAGTFADSNCFVCHTTNECRACHQRH